METNDQNYRKEQMNQKILEEIENQRSLIVIIEKCKIKPFGLTIIHNNFIRKILEKIILEMKERERS